MTIGDEVRKVKKTSLKREITELKSHLREMRNSNPDSSETDIEIVAYKMVIKEKEKELENI